MVGLKFTIVHPIRDILLLHHHTLSAWMLMHPAHLNATIPANINAAIPVNLNATINNVKNLAASIPAHLAATIFVRRMCCLSHGTQAAPNT
jgi:hypothetical protein